MAQIVGQTWKQEKRTKLKEIVDFGKTILQREGALRAQYFIESKKGNEIEISTMVLVFDNDEEKYELLKKVRTVTTNKEADRCYVLFEGWLSKVDKGERPSIRPRHDKNREEVMMVSYFDKNMKSSTTIIPFTKKEGKVIFSKADVLKKMESIWNPFIEFEGSLEKQNVMSKETDESFYNEQANRLFEKYEPRLKEAKTKEEKRAIAMEAMEEIKEIEKRIMDNIIDEEDENGIDR